MADRDGTELVVPSGHGSSLPTGNPDGLAPNLEAILPDLETPPTGRPLRKVGFIINDTIQAAIEQADRVGRMLAGNGVEVSESHSTSPDGAIGWTSESGLDLIFTFGG